MAGSDLDHLADPMIGTDLDHLTDLVTGQADPFHPVEMTAPTTDLGPEIVPTGGVGIQPPTGLRAEEREVDPLKEKILDAALEIEAAPEAGQMMAVVTGHHPRTAISGLGTAMRTGMATPPPLTHHQLKSKQRSLLEYS